MLADLCWPGFVQQDLLYENHKCPCVASAKCLCPKTEIYAFSFESTKMLTCCRSCIRITYVFLKIQSKLEDCVFFCGTLWEGFGNTQEEKMFLSLCNVECIYYFWWFSKHRWNLLFCSHQLNRGVVLDWYLISECLGISLFGALERTHCWKSVDVVVCQTLWLLGKIREFM